MRPLLEVGRGARAPKRGQKGRAGDRDARRGHRPPPGKRKGRWGRSSHSVMAYKQKVIHGDDLLYRFFQDALAKEPDLFAKVPQMMLEAMGVWFPCATYRDWPVLLPWVVRDPKCRGNKSKGLPDEWGSPDERGYLRDDNSLVKALPRALPIKTSGFASLSGARMGTEFVASHVWREVLGSDQLASRNPVLNSFIPNLVWLPAQVAKLTDREGGVVQQTLQSMAWAIYRKAPVAPHLEEVVEAAWKMIPEPEPVTISDAALNWFVETEQFLAVRAKRLDAVIEALHRLSNGQPLTGKVVATRYAAGLPGVHLGARAELPDHLRRFQPSTA
jgi:hypothetical protein